MNLEQALLTGYVILLAVAVVAVVAVRRRMSEHERNGSAAEVALALSELRYRTTLDTVAEGVILYDIDADGYPQPVLANPVAHHLLRLDLQGLQDLTPSAIGVGLLDGAGEPLTLDDLPVRVTAATGETVTGFVFGVARPGGTTEWIRMNTNPVRDVSGALTGVVASLVDVTAERAATQAAEMARARLAAMVEHGNDLISIIDRDNRLIYASPAYIRMTGRDPSRHIQPRDTTLIHPDDREIMLAAWKTVLASPNAVCHFQVRAAHADGSWRHHEIVSSNRLDDPAIGGIVSSSRDVTDRVEAATHLEHRANHDALTGLPNRALLMRRINLAVVDSERRGMHTAVLFVDLDGFKEVNDRRGHLAGDRLLETIAQRLTSAVGGDGTVSRFGGDEFVILIPTVGDDRLALEVATRARRAVNEPFGPEHGHDVLLGCSIGLAISSSPDPDELLSHADIALYAAKNQGKNCHVVFDAALAHHGDALRAPVADLAARAAPGL